MLCQVRITPHPWSWVILPPDPTQMICQSESHVVGLWFVMVPWSDLLVHAQYIWCCWWDDNNVAAAIRKKHHQKSSTNDVLRTLCSQGKSLFINKDPFVVIRYYFDHVMWSANVGITPHGGLHLEPSDLRVRPI